MYRFWYDYVNPRYFENAKLYYMYTDIVIFILFYIKTDDDYKDITKDVKIRFDTSNYKLDRPLPKAKNNWIGES